MPTIGRTLATVKLGVHKTHDVCRASLRKNGINVCDWSGNTLTLKKVQLSQTETDLELIGLSGTDLGFDEATRRDIIHERIIERGFDLCPAEAAIMLRESYKTQPRGEWLVVAMEPLIGDHYPIVFGIDHDEEGLWLSTLYGYPHHRYNPGNMFVVARRK